MKQENIFEKTFLGKKHKKALIILYASLFLMYGLYFLGEICGKAFYYMTH
jgi:hypothetical protein